jgi:2-polyprenyl-3-methyl-5-hydroxy-6-metoxy-1,4-benzoquinol methylase
VAGLPVIRYREADYAAHVARWVEQADEPDTVEPFVPLRVRVILAEYITFALAGREQGTVLDVGCRLGWLGEYLAGTGFDYEGVEPNVHAIAAARARALNVSPAPSREAYDVVFARQALQYVDDLPGFLGRLARLVAPGGLLCIVQSIPYTLEERHHFNAVDGLGDLLPHLDGLALEHAAPVATISKSEHVILARRPL